MWFVVNESDPGLTAKAKISETGADHLAGGPQPGRGSRPRDPHPAPGRHYVLSIQPQAWLPIQAMLLECFPELSNNVANAVEKEPGRHDDFRLLVPASLAEQVVARLKGCVTPELNVHQATPDVWRVQRKHPLPAPGQYQIRAVIYEVAPDVWPQVREQLERVQGLEPALELAVVMRTNEWVRGEEENLERILFEVRVPPVLSYAVAFALGGHPDIQVRHIVYRRGPAE
jgi:hypothetical protein